MKTIDVNAILSLLLHISPKDCKHLKKIRVGSASDGGYVIPNDLEGIQGLISIGVGPDVSFDFALAERGIPSYQYDHTVDENPSKHELFHFHKLGWADHSSGEFVDLQTMIESNGLDEHDDLFLKFDVEGAEWDGLSTVSLETLSKFRHITCELHGLTQLSHHEKFTTVKNTLEKLTFNHTCVHIHANNYGGIALVHGIPMPDVVEVSFLRNDRDIFAQFHGTIPSPLDAPNNAAMPDIILRAF